jgi:hypothetical protein
MRRPGLTLSLASIACLLALLPVAAQDEEPELITDRPDFTESSLVIPRGAFQLESGFTWTDETGKGDHTFSLPELLLRYSVGPMTELRLGAPDFIRSGRSGNRSNLFGDTYFGLKQQLVASDKPYGLALIPAVTLPTGSGDASSGAIDPELFLAWSKDLNERWSVAGLLGAAYSHEGHGRTFHFIPTVSFSYSVGERVGTFFEWAADLAPGRDSHLFHHGYTYALNERSQVDIHFGVGLTRAAPDFLIGAGYAIRF